MLKTLHNTKIKNKRVIVRVDFNEPIDHGRLTDDYRIRQTLPTLKWLLKGGNSLVLISHLGRPDGKRHTSMSLVPVARHTAKLLGRPITFVPDPFSARGRELLGTQKRGSIFMLENIRFSPGEEKNDQKFAKELSRFGDYFVNDAFGASHRAHASIAGIARFLPSCAGLLLEQEIIALDKMLHHQKKPFFVILAGGKASTKIELTQKYLKESDGVLLGGALANTIFQARGLEVGRSLSYAGKEIKKMIDISSKKLYLPSDVVVAKKVALTAPAVARPHDAVRKDELILDVGKGTVVYFAKVFAHAKTILWNGPLGVTEIPQFSKGTLGLIRKLKKSKAYKVTGGGDTVALLMKHKLMDVFDHVSTGGGAMLEYLAGKKMPGIEVLKR